MTRQVSLQTGLVVLLVVPIAAATALWGAAYRGQATVGGAYNTALRWSEHALAVKDESLLAERYLFAVHQALDPSDRALQARSEAQARQLGTALLAAADHATELARAFGPEEAAEDSAIQRQLAEFVDAATPAIIAAASDGEDASSAALATQADRFESTLLPQLSARVREESEGSRDWQKRAQATAASQVRLSLLFAALAVAMLAPSFFFVRQLRNGLRALHDGATRASKLDFSTPVVVSTQDELGEFAAVFNAMMSSVVAQHAREVAMAETRARVAALEGARADLEMTVRNRTAALADTNAELRLALIALTEASAAKSRFLSTMSHEIRTPLAGVLGTLELLTAGTLQPEQREYADLSLRSARALLALLNDVLDFSKFEAQGVTLDSAAFDAAQVAREVRELFLAQAERKGLALVPVCVPGPLWVMGDALRTRQVLGNLVGNAIKFTEHGQVRLEVEAIAEGPTTALRFTVEDTGVGIAPEHHATLFAPFAQGDDSTQRRFGGTGLGLAICRRLAEAMGGAITFDSQPDRGSRFSFTAQLPTAQPAEARAPAEEALRDVERAAMTGLRVLVAEDNPVNRLMISRLLERLGAQPTLVGNGALALEALETTPCDLVVMDVQMPVLDGLSATRAMRAAGKAWSQLPVVALTANAFQEDREACAAAGMTGFLSKPVTEVALVRTLLAVTGRSPNPSRFLAAGGPFS